MIKSIISSLILCGIFFVSCDNSVNTSAEFRERYILSSIINCDSTKQFVYITKTYDNNKMGRDPEIESIFVHGADVKIWYKYNVYELVDTTIIDSKGKVFSCYVATGLKPVSDNTIEIEALLPNNLLLSSITDVPVISSIRIENSNAMKISKVSSNLEIGWINNKDYIYDPKLIINYYYLGDTNSIRQEKIVPLDIIIKGEDIISVYPKPTNKPSISITRKALKYAMEEISKNDPLKSNYAIDNLELKLKVYDENLSAYYYSSHQVSDQFSISLDQLVYSNVDSGMGIFASLISKNLLILLDKEYVRSFGYKYGK